MHYNQQLLNLARGPLGLQAMGRPWGQKIGSNDKYNEWKLFVGQVPLEVSMLLLSCWSLHLNPMSARSDRPLKHNPMLI